MGLLSLAILQAHPTVIDIAWRMALAGAGFGLFQSPNNRAMITAAQGLIKVRDPDITSDPDVVYAEFKAQFIDTRLFFERYIGASEWPYFQAAHQALGAVRDRDEARRRVEEAQLFIEASHACYSRLLQARSAKRDGETVPAARAPE